MQVRPAGQAGYPISLVASLDTVPVKCCVPLHYLKREKREEKRRKFYIYPDVTHTHTTLSHTGMALGDIDLHFAWQAWPLLHWAGSGGVLGPRWSPVTPQHFAGQAWHLQTSTLVLHGRHGTC